MTESRSRLPANESSAARSRHSDWSTLGYAVVAVATHFVVGCCCAWLWRQHAATPVLFGQTVAIAFLLKAKPGQRRFIFIGTTASVIAQQVGFSADLWLMTGSVLAHVANMIATLSIVAVVSRSPRGDAQRDLTRSIFWITLLAPALAASVVMPFAALAGVPEPEHIFWARWSSNLIGAISVLPMVLTFSPDRWARLRRADIAPAFVATWLISLVTTWAAAAYFPFPFVLIAPPLLYAASRFLVFGASLISFSNVLLLVLLSLQPWQRYPALHEHATYVPFAIVFTLVSPLVVALLAQQRAQALAELASTHEAMAVDAERRRIMLDSIGDAVVSVDQTMAVEYVNPVAERLTGYSQAEAAGRQVDDVLQLFDDDGHGGLGARAESPLSRCMKSREVVVLDAPLLLRHRSGGVAYVGDSAAPVLSSDGRDVLGAVAVFQDVTQKQLASRALHRRAMHDALTDLFNRQEFELRARTLLSTREGAGTVRHAACFMDLDRFKAVNDTHGHAAGDAVLKAVAAVLSAKTRASDIVARLGGDEFAWVLCRCPDDVAERLAGELVSAIEALQTEWEGQILRVGASIGMVGFTPGECDYETLLRRADSACYAAKRGGRGRVAVYDPSLAERPR